MKVLGSYMIGRYEQRQLADGAGLDLPRDRLMANILTRALVDDLLWLKEPWQLVTSKMACARKIHQAVPCAVGGEGFPKDLVPYLKDCRIEQMSALTLSRSESRITLQIVAIGEHTVRVTVRFCQVDKFIAARPAA